MGILAKLIDFFLGHRAFKARKSKEELDWVVGCKDHPHVFSTYVPIFNLDINIHMNQAEYIANAEAARWAFAGEVGFGSNIFSKTPWVFVLGGQSVKYKKEMKWGQRYKILTTIDAVDDKWFYLSHLFVDQSEKIVFAHVLAKQIILCRKQPVPPSQLLKQVGYTDAAIAQLKSPNEAALSKSHMHWDDESYKTMKQFISNKD